MWACSERISRPSEDGQLQPTSLRVKANDLQIKGNTLNTNDMTTAIDLSVKRNVVNAYDSSTIDLTGVENSTVSEQISFN